MHNKYPYTDVHELNLDWILARMRQLEIEFDTFEVINKITFSGAWDITKQYPAWTLVSDNNIGYVSIQPVPAGVVLNNTDYWRVMIDYTAQIAGLQTRVVALENTVGDASSGLVKDVDDLQTTVGDASSGLVKDVSDNASDIADLQMIADLSHKKFLFVGDSFATPATGWVWRVTQYLNITNYDNLAVNGTSFHDGTFLDQITNYAGTRDDVSDIIIGGGLNDSIYEYGDDATALTDALTDFLTYAHTNYPKAKVWLAFMGNALDDSSLLSGRTFNKRRWAKFYYNAARGYAKIAGCDVSLSTNVNNYGADRLHPSNYGADNIAQCVVNAILGLQGDIVYPSFSAGVTKASAFNNATTDIPINYEINNDIARIKTGDILLNVSAAMILNTMTDALVCSFSNIYFNDSIVLRSDAVIHTSGHAYKVPVILTFYQNNLMMKPILIDNNNDYYNASLAANDQIKLLFNDVTFPTLAIN